MLLSKSLKLQIQAPAQMKFNLVHSCTTLFLLTLFFSVSVEAQNVKTDREAYTRNAEDSDLTWSPCPDFMPESCRIAVVQGDPAKPNADVFFKMEGNTSVAEHWHHSAERMVLISGKMQVQYESQEPAVLNPGDYAYGPPKKPHKASCLSESPCVLFIAFEKPIDAFSTR